MRVGYLELAHPGRDLAVLLASFSPAAEPDGEAAAYFDANGMDGLFGPPPDYGRRLLAAAGDPDARVGFGPGKWFAQVAARRAEPGSVAIVAPAGAAAFARDLPVDWLPLPPKAAPALAALGIRTVGQLAALPPGTLAPRLGREAVLAHQIARGEDPRPLRPPSPADERSATRRWDTPLVDMAVLLAATARLLAPLCRQLHAEGLTYRALTLALEREDGRTAHGTRRLPRPADTADAAQVILPDLVGELGRAPVGAVTVTLSGLAAAAVEQPSLFPEETTDRERHRRVERAVGELLRRYPGHLGRLVASAPHAPLPEQRWRFATAHATVPVRVVRRGGRRVIEVGGRWETVTASQRVWQVDLWWPQPRQRRYVQVRTCGGRTVTVYHDSLERGWFLADRLD